MPAACGPHDSDTPGRAIGVSSEDISFATCPWREQVSRETQEIVVGTAKGLNELYAAGGVWTPTPVRTIVSAIKQIAILASWIRMCLSVFGRIGDVVDLDCVWSVAANDVQELFSRALRR
jgi:hypothetical protein